MVRYIALMAIFALLVLAACGETTTESETEPLDSEEAAPQAEEAMPDAEAVPEAEEAAPAELDAGLIDCGESAVLDQAEPVTAGDEALICFGKAIVDCTPSTVTLSYEGDVQVNTIVADGDACSMTLTAGETVLTCPLPPVGDAELPSDDAYAEAAFGLILAQPLMALDPESGCTQG